MCSHGISWDRYSATLTTPEAVVLWRLQLRHILYGVVLCLSSSLLSVGDTLRFWVLNSTPIVNPTLCNSLCTPKVLTPKASKIPKGSFSNYVDNNSTVCRFSLITVKENFQECQPGPEIRQSTIKYAGSLGRWDKRLFFQASDVHSIIFFFIKSCKILCKNPFNLFFFIKLQKWK